MDGELLIGFSEWVMNNAGCYADRVLGEFNELSNGRTSLEDVDSALIDAGYKRGNSIEFDQVWEYYEPGIKDFMSSQPQQSKQTGSSNASPLQMDYTASKNPTASTQSKSNDKDHASTEEGDSAALDINEVSSVEGKEHDAISKVALSAPPLFMDVCTKSSCCNMQNSFTFTNSSASEDQSSLEQYQYDYYWGSSFGEFC